ncbi:MAG: hypothetical protein B6I31_05480 [Desulfobacteraceae bacterium 4572_19]|nr:MAG: hypothetical protein B6I31_05480 [Desulfobacteraceae bacterium 4572_19]
MLKKTFDTHFSASIKATFLLYEFIWKAIIPLLKHKMRTLNYRFPKADIWIQVASVGESYLLYEILDNFHPKRPLVILLTSNTLQGLEILNQIALNYNLNHTNLNIKIAYFPFDKPSFMKKAVKQINPQLAVMLETEIWPGLFYALKRQNIKIVIANARITTKSLNGYKKLPFIWPAIAPTKILAVSDDDALRFASLFNMENIKVMPNIKFDKMEREIEQQIKNNPLRHLISPLSKFIVLGSIRKEEESDVGKIICKILSEKKDAVIGLFCRHIHRAKNLEKILNGHLIPSVLRSQISDTVPNGTVIIWDKFGELIHAYSLAKAAFVGGSLYPKGGGQNFLEPLTCGIAPVIGPHWETFAWVGKKIITQKLVYEAQDWKEVSDILLENIMIPLKKEKIIIAAYNYMKKNRGGSAMVAKELII